MAGTIQSSPRPRLTSATVARLDHYATTSLACPVALARRGGVHLLPVRERSLPIWLGFTMPIIALSFPRGAVITVRQDLPDALREEMGSDVRLPALDAAALRRLHRSVRRVVHNAYTLMGDMRAVDADLFVPSPTVHRAELIPKEDHAAAKLAPHFDGEIFGVRAPHGPLASYAALKIKSPDVWEIAVGTEPDYRGRGYARDSVSAATAYALRHGKLVLYVHDRDNSSSAFVARSLGYQTYCEIVLAEY